MITLLNNNVRNTKFQTKLKLKKKIRKLICIYLKFNTILNFKHNIDIYNCNIYFYNKEFDGSIRMMYKPSCRSKIEIVINMNTCCAVLDYDENTNINFIERLLWCLNTTAKHSILGSTRNSAQRILNSFYEKEKS